MALKKITTKSDLRKGVMIYDENGKEFAMFGSKKRDKKYKDAIQSFIDRGFQVK